MILYKDLQNISIYNMETLLPLREVMQKLLYPSK